MILFVYNENRVAYDNLLYLLKILTVCFCFCFFFSRTKYRVEEVKNNYKVHMYLDIQNLNRKDLGTYKCLATNSMGHANGSIRVHGE